MSSKKKWQALQVELDSNPEITIKEFCSQRGISYSSGRKHLKRSNIFKAIKERAKEEATEIVVQEARQVFEEGCRNIGQIVGKAILEHFQNVMDTAKIAQRSKEDLFESNVLMNDYTEIIAAEQVVTQNLFNLGKFLVSDINPSRFRPEEIRKMTDKELEKQIANYESYA